MINFLNQLWQATMNVSFKEDFINFYFKAQERLRRMRILKVQKKLNPDDNISFALSSCLVPARDRYIDTKFNNYINISDIKGRGKKSVVIVTKKQKVVYITLAKYFVSGNIV